MTGACQNAALLPEGSRTVTWQSYAPGGSLVSGILKAKGMVFTRLSQPSVTCTGRVSKVFAGFVDCAKQRWPVSQIGREDLLYHGSG